MDQSDKSLRITIIGGGLGGMMAALFLRAAGFEPIVMEQSASSGETGAGIVVPPNMVRLLRMLDLENALQSFAVRLDAAWEFRRWQTGQVLSVQPMGQVCQDLYGTDCYVAHRADLLAMLTNAFPAHQLKLDRKCVSVQATDQTVAIELQDQNNVRYQHHSDLVIGADGIHSVVRNAVTTPSQPAFSGLCAFRCLVPAAQAPAMALRPVQTLWLGPDRHFVHYPISRATLVNVVAIVPAGDWRDESWTAQGQVADMAAQFYGWDKRISQLINSATQTKRWALYDRPPLERWVCPRIALLGDAAHPMLPFFAQGAAQAAEDAYVRAQCLQNTSAVPEALQNYQTIREPRASKVQTMSRDRHISNHLADGSAQRERDAQLAKGNPLAQSAWLYGYDPSAQGLTELYQRN